MRKFKGVHVWRRSSRMRIRFCRSLRINSTEKSGLQRRNRRWKRQGDLFQVLMLRLKTSKLIEQAIKLSKSRKIYIILHVNFFVEVGSPGGKFICSLTDCLYIFVFDRQAVGQIRGQICRHAFVSHFFRRWPKNGSQD